MSQRLAALAAATALATAALGLGAPAPAEAAAVPFDNGQTITDTSGNLMHAHGGGILKEGNTYYLVGEQRNGYLFDQVSMYSSTDLVNWTFRNDILSAESDPELSPANIERPKVIYNAATDKYVLWAHKENGVDYGDAEVAVAVSDTIDGDYDYQGSFRPLGYDSRDMTLFVDTDGEAYLISAADVNYDLNVYRLTDDYLGVEELVHVFDGYHREAPAVFKRGSVYFLVTSGATGWNANQTRYATTANFPEGAWSGWSNAGDATTYGSQPTFVATVSGTAGTSYLYMGDRWGPQWGGKPMDSEYVWLPIAFPSSTTMSLTWYPTLNIDAAAGTVQGVAGSDDGSPYSTKFVNAGSGKCIDVPSGSGADGTALIQYGCWNGAPQAFTFDPVYPGSKVGSIANTATGKCWDVLDQSTASGAPVGQWGCWAGGNQRFSLRAAAGGGHLIVAQHSGLCVSVSGSSTADGAAIVQSTCTGAANQRWAVTVR
ncbi:RICIN domain-containing protein [Glycomyces terrestris]|uniref:Beta-xylosidase n=1 Tax=Glycomyces terrestris TaxID=2493553 RepID=A0A426UU01_9ACTN|nr:RICIN domain-containing protein [Glycomyces terrestris]RRR97391.1 beta-xylosidase [Glycomyces terrestris]